MKTLYETGIEENQNFVQNLAMFLSTLLKKRGQLFETEAMRKQLLMAVMYLIVISQVEDVEVFKICLEYWGSLTEQLYKECPLDDRVVASSTIPMRRLIYEEMLSKLRYIMIGRMAKPEEVLVVENEQGEVVREFMKDTDSIQLYNNMRETLVYLTHLNSQDTENIMNEKLKKQVDGTEWSWKNLNTVSKRKKSFRIFFHLIFVVYFQNLAVLGYRFNLWCYVRRRGKKISSHCHQRIIGLM